MNKFSIILPVRNGGEHIKICVNSILSQSLQDFELLVLDNCSTDGTKEWISSLNNEKITLISSDRPLSIEESWARAAQVKKNEFMTLIGHDDVLQPGFLETIDGLIKAVPTASLYHTHFDFIDAVGKHKRDCKPMPAGFRQSQLLNALLTNSIEMMGTGYVMHSADYDELGGIPTRYPNLLFADFELWLRLTGKGFESISPYKGFSFREHTSTTGTSLDIKMHGALEAFTGFLANLAEHSAESAQVIKAHANQFLLQYCQSYAHRLLRTPAEKREGLTVAKFVDQTKKMAGRLGIGDAYHPEKKRSIRLAMIIDKIPLLRKLFLLFKKAYSKPVLSS